MQKYFSLMILTALCNLATIASDHKKPFHMFNTTRDFNYSIAEQWEQVIPFKELHTRTLKAMDFNEEGVKAQWNLLGTSVSKKAGHIILIEEQEMPRGLLLLARAQKNIIIYQSALDTENIPHINDVVREAICIAYPEAEKAYFLGEKNEQVRTIFKLLNWNYENNPYDIPFQGGGFHVFSLSLKN